MSLADSVSAVVSPLVQQRSLIWVVYFSCSLMAVSQSRFRGNYTCNLILDGALSCGVAVLAVVSFGGSHLQYRFLSRVIYV